MNSSLPPVRLFARIWTSISFTLAFMGIGIIALCGPFALFCWLATGSLAPSWPGLICISVLVAVIGLWLGLKLFAASRLAAPQADNPTLGAAPTKNQSRFVEGLIFFTQLMLAGIISVGGPVWWLTGSSRLALSFLAVLGLLCAAFAVVRVMNPAS